MSQVAEQTLSIPIENDCAPINALAIATYNAEGDEQPTHNGNKGQIQPGQVLNPAGRPKGTRNKLSEAFLLDLQTAWGTATTDKDGLASTTGLDVIRTLAKEQPAKLLAAMVQVLPKDFQVSVDVDQVQWVINASPRLTELEWQEQHNLIDQDPTETA